MKFSVLMSLYIKENPQYLAECLQSLVKQTIQADEIVLVFDGVLTSELEKVVAEFSDKLPFNIVYLEKNGGLAKALNIGLTHCSNEWVFRMDTDDICVPDRFEKQVKFIKSHPDTVILGGQIAEFGENIQNIVSYRNVPTDAKDIVKFAAHRCPFNHMTVAYQKSTVLDCGGYQDLQEDYNLWIKLMASGQKIANLPDILVYARVGNGMVSRRRGIAYAKSEWRLFKLKYRLGIQGLASSLLTFTMRALPRLMPVAFLQIVYKFLRK